MHRAAASRPVLLVSLLLLGTAGLKAEPDPVVPAGVEELDGRPWTFVAAGVGGTLRDAVTGAPVVGALVRIKRARGLGEPFVQLRTDAAGSFAVRLRFGTYFVDLDAVGYATILDQEVYTGLAEVSPPLNVALSRPVGEDEIRIALSWTGEKPDGVRDVDAYLRIPVGSGNVLYFNRKGGADFHGANLDRDDTDWEGPETMTIKTVLPGTYLYYVNSFTKRDECTALARSAIRVSVTRGRRTLRTYTLEPGREEDGEGHTYKFFEIVDGALVDTRPDGTRVAGYDDSLLVGGNNRGIECRNQPGGIRWGTLEEPAR